jgi:alpha,alpha-trehalase
LPRPEPASNAGPEAPALPRSALEAKDEIAALLADKPIAVLLDYDGTLTPIVDNPANAVLAEEMRAAVRELARRAPVAVISGRDLEDVGRLVGIKSVVYAGSHGFDMRFPGGRRLEHARGAEYLPALDAAEQELRTRLRNVPGARVERKKFAIAAHYRRAQESDVPAIEAALDDVLRQHAELRKTSGKKVFELRPAAQWHKGSAVLWLLRELGLNDGLPVYIGDDETDEDAFAALRGRGITIAVRESPRPTAARYTLRDSAEVRHFLEWLARTIAPTRTPPAA